jgi:hypothetical protein
MMASKFRKMQKRLRKRERGRARAVEQPVAAQQTQSGVEVLRNLAQRFDEAFESKSLRKTLVDALASKS